MALSLLDRYVLGAVDRREFAEMDPREVIKIKQQAPFLMRAVTKARVGPIDEDRMTVDYLASVEVIDRMGDILRVKPGNSKADPAVSTRGLDPTDWMRMGGQFFWSHMSDRFPIGNVETVKTVSRAVSITNSRGVVKDRKVPSSLQRVAYIEDIGDFKFGSLVFELVKAGKIGSVSVGLVPKEIEFLNQKDIEDFNGPGFGFDIRGWDQIELSQAPVPANQFAVVDGMEKHLQKSIDELVDGGQVSAALARDFERWMPYSPAHMGEMLHAKVRSFFDMKRITEPVPDEWAAPEMATQQRDVEIEVAETRDTPEPLTLSVNEDTENQLYRGYQVVAELTDALGSLIEDLEGQRAARENAPAAEAGQTEDAERRLLSRARTVLGQIGRIVGGDAEGRAIEHLEPETSGSAGGDVAAQSLLTAPPTNMDSVMARVRKAYKAD